LADGGLVIWNVPKIQAQLARIGLAWRAEARPPQEQQPQPFMPATPAERKHQVAQYSNLGKRLAWVGRVTEAEEAYRAALRLAPDDPDAHENIGSLQSQMGKPAEALPALQKALAIRQKLADANPTVSRHQVEVARVHNNLGRLLVRQERYADALTAIDTGLVIRQKLVEADAKNTVYTNHLGYSHACRGWALVRSGQPSQAAADLRRALELWAKVPPLEIDKQVERSRALALLAGLGGDAKSGVTKAEARTFADQSVAALADVVKTGWALPSELKEPDFDALRGRADFQKLVAEVEAKAAKKEAESK
jgi:tetratricopeptide (TPR) repeat protein